MVKRILICIAVAAISSGLYGQSSKDLNNSHWDAMLSDSTQLRLTLKTNKRYFRFHSRPGSAKAVLGNKYLIARLLGKVKAHTVEIRGQYNLKNDTLFLKGIYQSLTSKQEFTGTIFRSKLKATMSNNTMSGKLAKSYSKVRDYYSIASAAVDTTKFYLFDPDILQSKIWIQFTNKVLKLSKVVADDYEFEKMYNFNAQKLPFTHYGVILNKPEKKITNTKNEAQPTKFEIERINSETVLFKIKSFSASAQQIQPFIDTLKTSKFNNLIIDLRNNGGGTIASALPLARYLVNDTLYGGLFLTQKYFKTHQQLPSPESFKNFELFSEASFDLIIKGIHTKEGLCLIVYPDASPFIGKLYILTNNRTGSTCEPLVYGLQYSKRAIIVGERTMGAMLNGELFSIHKNYSLWMPTADYYTADGKKLDRVGVEPDVI